MGMHMDDQRVTWDLKDVWEYDPETDTWTQKEDFRGKSRIYAVSFSIGTKAYIGSGKLTCPTCDDTEKGLSIDSSRLSSGSKGYSGAAAGSNPYTKDFWSYNSATNTWSRKADLGVTTNYPPKCAAPVNVAGSNYFTIQDAYNNAASGSTVQITEGLFNTGNLEFNRDISTKVDGGYNCEYNIKTGYSTIDGTVTIKDGSVTVEGLIIK